MKIFRSINNAELSDLLGESIVCGKYNCKREKMNNCDLKNMCCFFVDEVMWKDKQHQFLLVVDIPAEDLYFGTGNYNAARSFANTKIWSGRWGEAQYNIREAYCNFYDISKVKEIYLFGHYTDSYVEHCILPVCKKYNIILHHAGNEIPFKNSKQMFVEGNDGIYRTKENFDGWEKQYEVDAEKYIEDMKKMLLNSEIDLSQAKKIRLLLKNN